MYLEIVSPEATLFKGEVESIAVPGINGEFQMLKDHAPIVSILGKGDVKIFGDVELGKEFADKFSKGDKNETLLPINSGTIELNNNKVIILAD
ncbi:F-type H+-transporting ATPase subunit epsilon [Zhouia amylolytica]|uniref:ATPase F1 subunit delta/epsilon subunit n=2 Tax=Zhouia amylolytica TaxID=376730 RepID=W2UMS6_9FLAO|nr:F0F1 ATP synthase subunit epsilon [Zhouia amylolytica]ETN94657.1 ATPase F1 subunit delta/epsilon subunit [Zhouia amylolytica AD3]MCQ0111656.1 F0F1 ATP synthase subunit epsilon [Zhouia amylolytica]SFS76099.1 F-type H+-transporting ATPase subunit epsilon [Zhouia amylolytica]